MTSWVKPRAFDDLTVVRGHGRKTRRGVAPVRRHTRHRHVTVSYPLGQTPQSDPEMVIEALLSEFGSCGVRGDPAEINSGSCQDFATRLHELLPGAQLWDGRIGRSDLGIPYEHVYVRYLGRYYDAETPQGVHSAYELPYFERLECDRGAGITEFDDIDETPIAPTLKFRENTRLETAPLIPRVLPEPEETGGWR